MSSLASRLAATLVVSAIAVSAQAASIQKSLDVEQGFALKPDVSSPVGCLQSLQIGSVTLAADLETKFPLAPASTAKCVAVLSSFSWGGEVADAVELVGRVSPANQALLAAKPVGDVTFQLAIYDYDSASKKYFAAVSSGSVDLKGTLAASQLTVASERSPSPATPPNFEAKVAIKPLPVAQKINVAAAPGKYRAKAWGAP